MSLPNRGLLEELLSALLGRAALLARLIERDPDPCWRREFDICKRRVAEVQERLRGEL